MNVASLELCKELYELSGWDDCSHMYDDDNGETIVTESKMWNGMTPAYDLGYLLRKLPKPAGVGQMLSSDEVWIATCGKIHPNKHLYLGADTPENAACKLAIALFQTGVLEAEKGKLDG